MADIYSRAVSLTACVIAGIAFGFAHATRKEMRQEDRAIETCVVLATIENNEAYDPETFLQCIDDYKEQDR